MAEQRNIQYLNKDFSSIKQSLIDYAKTYFPNTYNDFSPASPGMMFIEMAAYVGDVLSYYQDTQLQEAFIQYAQEKQNLYTLAYMLGYRPKVTTSSTVKLDVYQILPSMSSGSVKIPDWSYSLVIDPGSTVRSSEKNIDFYIKDRIDFSVSSSFDPTDLTVFSLSGGLPDYYLLKKQVNAFAGTEKSTTFTFGSPERLVTATLTDDKIIEITSVTDSNNNTWYEVPYLAQEMIFDEVSNDITNDPNFAQYKDSAPYLLKLKKVQRRFSTRFKSTGELELQFGVGNESNVDEVIIPNPDNVGLGTSSGLSKMNTAYDPSNFMFTKTYGIVPANTTLTVKYLVGGGVESNVAAGSITDLSNIVSSFKFGGLNSVLSNRVLQSIAISNTEPAVGGGDGDNEEEIRFNALSSFPSQQRAVTLPDYLIRTYSLPPKFGFISKAYVVQDSQINASQFDNPLALSIYVLSQGTNGVLSTASPAVKQNLKTYLSQYRMLTDSISIKDAFIINIGVNFDIMVLPRYNNQEVILNCINTLIDYFDIKKWQINQPIILSELYVLLDKVKGVQTVKNIDIVNKSGVSLGYSKYAYDIKGATQNRVIYPSLDPSIFEVKYPTLDINGRSSGF
jgi:hypothetical protein